VVSVSLLLNALNAAAVRQAADVQAANGDCVTRLFRGAIRIQRRRASET